MAPRDGVPGAAIYSRGRKGVKSRGGEPLEGGGSCVVTVVCGEGRVAVGEGGAYSRRRGSLASGYGLNEKLLV